MEKIRIHPDTIAEVNEKVDIVEIISESVVLRKRGQNFIGLCPFHEEKTPSFSVNPQKQFYHCFGCGAGGNALKFLMEIGKQSFTDVVLDLAQRYQIPIKSLAPEQSQEIQKQISIKEQLYQILALSASFYHHALYQPEGKNALEYLQKQRNLTTEIINDFQLGFAPSGWETIFRYLVEVKRYPVALVEQSGLIKERSNGNGYIDRFRERLMIPICDIQGRVIAFGSRCLDGSEPKYVNSPDTILFNKGKTLFCLDRAKNSIIKEDKVIVVEGYFDAIALQSVGIKNTVACLGTAFTQEHLKQVSKYTESKEIIFNFDGDNAGLKATKRTLNEIESLIYAGQVQVKIVLIPEGKDADEFINSDSNGVTKYQELVTNAPLWLDWEIAQILTTKNLKKANEFQQAFQDCVRLLNKINNSVTRNYYLTYCAELLTKGKNESPLSNSEDYKQLYKNLQLAIKNKPLVKNKPTNNQVSGESVLSPSEKKLQVNEFTLLLIYLHCPQYRDKIIAELEEKDLTFVIPHHRFLWQKILEIESIQSSQINPNQNYLINQLQEDLLNFPEQNKKLLSLFNPDDNQQQYLINSLNIITDAISQIESVRIAKFKQYYVQKLGELKDNDFDNVKNQVDLYTQKLGELGEILNPK
jgi:DNA primase